MSEPAKVHSLEDIHSALAPKTNRVIYTYKVPADIAAQCGISSVGLVELTPNEMLLAQSRAGDDKGQTLFELVKESWRRVDGKPIHTGDGSADVAWGQDKPGMNKLRTLLTGAFNKINNPKKDENEAFLASETASVG
jgi:hypothetical protein